MAGILDWTKPQYVHYSDAVTMSNKTGQSDFSVFRDFILVISAPLVVSNKLIEPAAFRFFGGNSSSRTVSQMKGKHFRDDPLSPS